MPRVGKSLTQNEIERFDGLVSSLMKIRQTLGGHGGTSRYDRIELHPGYLELQKHVDWALRWAEEMKMIIADELTPRS